jgi:UDP-N-acetylglucosamine acyltransferase
MRVSPCELVIGDRNTIREFCTFNIGSPGDQGVTRVGSDNWIMAYVHVAHDCVVGNHTIFANTSTLAGHVHVGDWVILGGFTGVHQFVKIGAHSMTAVGSVLLADLPPFVMAQGQPARARSMNFEGLRRRGFSAERIAAVKAMHKVLYRDHLTLAQACERIADLVKTQPGVLTRCCDDALIFGAIFTSARHCPLGSHDGNCRLGTYFFSAG